MEPESTRRDFLSTALAATPLLGLMLPAPPSAEEMTYGTTPIWRGPEEEWVGDETYIWDTGATKTWLFPSQCPTAGLWTWYMRCGSMWRPGDLFRGTLAEAKREAERWTREALCMAVIAVEKVVFDLCRP